MPKTPRESRELKGGIGIVATYFGELSAIDLCVLKNAWINRLHLHSVRRKNEMRMIMLFLRDDQGQDLIEYTLLLAFVCLASAALFISAGGSVGGVWNQANSQLTTANAAAAS